jgi:hypothetical protein
MLQRMPLALLASLLVCAAVLMQTVLSLQVSVIMIWESSFSRIRPTLTFVQMSETSQAALAPALLHVVRTSFRRLRSFQASMLQTIH